MIPIIPAVMIAGMVHAVGTVHVVGMAVILILRLITAQTIQHAAAHTTGFLGLG